MKNKKFPKKIKPKVVNVADIIAEMQTEFPFHLVKLAPDLQDLAATLTPSERRDLANMFGDWSHQLTVSANVLEMHASPWRRRSLPRIDPQKLPLN
jgi:hypothetical protein